MALELLNDLSNQINTSHERMNERMDAIAEDLGAAMETLTTIENRITDRNTGLSNVIFYNLYSINFSCFSIYTLLIISTII